MSKATNTGFDSQTIEEYRTRIQASGKNYVLDDEDEMTDEYAHFYFVGKFEGKEVIYDAVMYTLRLEHESEMFEIAEHRAAQHFPQYKKITFDEDENGNMETLDPLEEEIGLYMAEVIMELEEEESVKVKEHIDFDEHVDFGVSLDVSLHADTITPSIIEKFITDYNGGNLALDPTLYSFQTEDESE
ncbi:MAG: hypothetical protein JNM57_11405 [Cyclobacteriaceae bacterium]|nr:hypothetical protein [Cyclobacteriaceae bacterium]